MEKNYWQIDDNLYKVYISADVYNELEQDFKNMKLRKYIKDGDIIAYDIMVERRNYKKS